VIFRRLRPYLLTQLPNS